MIFKFYRPPLAHQLTDFENFKDTEYHALFHEQRVRKTKIELDIFRYRYSLGHVTALLVIAFPNGVHRVWIDELTKDFPPDFLAQTKSYAWTAAKVATTHRADVIALRDHSGPVVLTMNCEALITPRGWDYLEWFLKTRKTMIVADEASFAAKWSKRTQKLQVLGRRPNAKIRAILDGTPVDESPIEIYHPTQFLKKGLLGFQTKEAFRSRYTQYEEETDEHGVVRRSQKTNHRTGAVYDVKLGYRNLDELQAKLKTFSSRVLRSDVSDAPPKTYQSRYFDLTTKQRRVYDRLRDEFILELSDRKLPASNVLARMTWLQMVARNYVPPRKTGVECGCAMGYLDNGEECPTCDGLGYVVELSEMERIDDKSPSMAALAQEAQVSRGPIVVWCRFIQDVADSIEALRGAGRDPYRYDGTVNERDREMVYDSFRAGYGDSIVATETCGLQRGHDLQRAETTIYYSNDWSRRARSQSEDRTESLDRKISTSVVDLIAADTRDLDVIDALRNKRDLAALVTGDAPSKWI